MRCILLNLLIAFSFTITAQTTGTISGIITDLQTGNGIPYATVSFRAGTLTLGTRADEKGNYTVKLVPVGIFNLEFGALGYQRLSKAEVKVTAGAISFVNAALPLKEGPEVEIIHEKWRDSVITKGLMPLITPIDVETITQGAGGRTIGEIIPFSVPRVSQGPGGNLNFSGSRSGSTLYLVDGVKVMGPEPNIPNRGIAEISVYIGGIPAQYGDTTSGVVVINTRSYQ
jgi:hypothetical protein